MFHATPRQIFILGIVVCVIDVDFFLLAFEVLLVDWVLIHIGSIFLFLAGYIWLNDLITTLSERA